MPEYKTRFNCPGCGSPLQTLEGAISLQCSFCGMVMRIGAPGRILKYYYRSDLDSFALKFAVERYLKDNGRLSSLTVDSTTLYYLPFYRFRGMSYSLIAETKIEDEQVDIDRQFIPTRTVFHQRCRHFDLTIPAFENPAFGLDSLGVRPEVIPLDIFSSDALPADAIVLDIQKNPDQAKQAAMGMFAFNLGFALEGKDHLISEMIGEGLSIIYHPVWRVSSIIDGLDIAFLIDGLSKRIINEIPESFEAAQTGKDCFEADPFKPMPHRCPNCGADFPASEVSIVYYCPNCRKSYIVASDSYRPIETQAAVYEQGIGSYPFWRFPFTGGRGEKTVGEFARILTGEIPLIAKGKAQNPFYLYLPAFKLADLDSLTARAIRLNRTQPILETGEQEFAPAADMILPESEAQELARFYWQVIRAKYRHLNSPDYDFARSKIGTGEIIWLTLTESSEAARKGIDSLRVR